jgi:hypothetical protein
MSLKDKRTGAPAPLLKNASAAPFIHFDNAPVYGAFAGCIEVELAARALMPKESGAVVAEAVCTGHLRCTPQAAVALADALTKAVEMHRAQLLKQAAPQDSEGEADKAA